MITYKRFKKVFTDRKAGLPDFTSIPKNKEVYMYKLYSMYMYGRKNREDEILSNMENLLINGKK